VLLPRQPAKLARGTKDKEHAMSQTPNTAIAVIGIDIGKNSFHVVGHNARGAIVLRQKWSRGQVEARLANIPPCLIGMEACVGAHHLSRKPRLRELADDPITSDRVSIVSIAPNSAAIDAARRR
jgi:transposase